MLETIVAIFVLVVFVIAGAYLYKKRVSVARWLNDPDMIEDKHQKRVRLQRHIEDCQYRIEQIDKDTKED